MKSMILIHLFRERRLFDQLDEELIDYIFDDLIYEMEDPNNPLWYVKGDVLIECSNDITEHSSKEDLYLINLNKQLVKFFEVYGLNPENILFLLHSDDSTKYGEAI